MLRTIWKRMNSTEITQLGRWNIETCAKKMKLKIDRANMDNCGSCVLEKKEQQIVCPKSGDANNHEVMIHAYMYLQSA